MKKDHIFSSDECAESVTSRETDREYLLDTNTLTALDAVPDALLAIGHEKIVFANKAFGDVFGWGLDSILGRPLDIFCEPSDGYENIMRFTSEGPQGMESFCERVVCVSKDGRKIPCRVKGRHMQGNGSQGLAVIVFQDISDYAKVEEAFRKNEEKYSNLLETIEAAYYELDNEGRFTFINGSLRRGIGFREDEILGTHFGRFMDEESSEKVGRLIKDSYDTGRTSLMFEAVMFRKNGSRVYIESWASVLKDEAGNRTGFQGIGLVISKQKRALEALRRSEEKYSGLLEAIEAAYFELDLNGNFTFFNGAMRMGFMYHEDELKGMSYMQLVAKEDVERLYNLFNDFYKNRKPWMNFELEMIRKDGMRVTVEVWASVLRDHNGKIIGTQGIGHDITVKKRVQKALEESEAKYRLHFTSISDVVFSLDAGYTITSVSPSVERILKFTPDEIMGKPFKELNILLPESLKQALEDADKVFAGNYLDSSLYEFTAKDGVKKYGEISASPVIRDGRVISVLGVARDVTERILAENAMLENEKRFRDIFDNVSDYLYFHDLEGYLSIDEANKTGRQIWDYSEEKGSRINIKDFMLPRFRELFDEYLLRIKEKGKDEGYISVFDKKGQERVLEYRNSLVYENGVPIGVRGSARDITDRIRVESALKKSEEKYRNILKEIEDGYYETDLAGNMTFFNDAMCTMLGYHRDELMGMNSRKLTDEENAEGLFKVFNHVFKTGKSDRGFGYELVKKDGSRVPVETSVSLMKDTEGKAAGFRGICRDISRRVQEEEERKKLESRLQQAQKMEAIGALAGGVAHDLNNILSGLVSYPELILMDLPADDPLRKPISTIQNSGEKAAAIVQDLLTLARRGVSTTEVINPFSIVSDYMKSPEFMKLKTDHPGVRINVHCDSDLLPIMGSPFHLGKTIMNLVTNAAEAILDKGTITINVRNTYLDRPPKGYDKVVEGEYVAITISDTGAGISTEDRERIFEPFYTRKVMGRSGTGLGMTVVLGTVQDHHGYIEILSMEGNGTTFTIYLPATRAMIKDRPSRDIKDFMGKGESIMVVDDVSLQREIATRILTRLGYRVVSFGSGEEAVEYLKDNTVDLVVLDMIMDPGIDGLETYRRILEYHPRQKALIASGYSETRQVRELLRLGAGAYIKKPYLIETLGVAIRKELE